MQQEKETDTSILVRSAQEGDGAAFTALVHKHYDQMYRYALRFSGQVSDAEDITQQACMKLARSIHQFRFESAFNTWLYRLVTNCAKDWLRSAGNRAVEPLDENYVGPSIEDSSAQIQLEQVLRQVDEFGAGFRETTILVLAEGLSHKDAAVVLGVKESTISWRLHEVRKRLAAAEVQS